MPYKKITARTRVKLNRKHGKNTWNGTVVQNVKMINRCFFHSEWNAKKKKYTVEEKTKKKEI